MSRLNPFLVQISKPKKVNRLLDSQVLVEPAVNHDHNWKAEIKGGSFYWKTKAAAVKNLKRIYGYAEEV